MREQGLFLDSSRGRLFGVICEGTQGARTADTWVVFLNAATVRRIGNHRLSATWAREWAQAGLPSLRFDNFGVGDSDGPEREEGPPVTHYRVLYDPDRVTTILEVLDWLVEHREARRFALVGLSSGGTLGFHAALANDRVAAVTLLNAPTLFWDDNAAPLEAWEDARSVILDPRLWRERLLRRGVRSWATEAARGAALRLRGIDDSWQRQKILESADRLRRSSILLVFRAEDAGLAYFERHLGPDYRSVLADLGFAVEVIQGPDHTFRPLWSHDLVHALLERQLRGIGFLGDQVRTLHAVEGSEA